MHSPFSVLSESGAPSRLEDTFFGLVDRVDALSLKGEASARALGDLECALVASREQCRGLETLVGAQSRDIAKLVAALARAEAGEDVIKRERRCVSSGASQHWPARRQVRM